MDGKNYSAVPPPPSLSASSKDAAPLNFNDALSKARAIAEKLKQQSSGGGGVPEQPVAATTSGTMYTYLCFQVVTYTSFFIGTKRGYYDDDREDSRPSYNSSRSYGSYQDDRDSKRSAYDGGSSRPSCELFCLYLNTTILKLLIDGNSNESRRYGLGSEERKPSYGGSHSAQHQEEYSVPNHMVGLLIGKGGENLKKIERVSGVHKVQFANGIVFDTIYIHVFIHS
jgi:far upstream element-binding protein